VLSAELAEALRATVALIDWQTVDFEIGTTCAAVDFVITDRAKTRCLMALTSSAAERAMSVCGGLPALQSHRVLTGLRQWRREVGVGVCRDR
jgi:hypothetical protein